MKNTYLLSLTALVILCASGAYAQVGGTFKNLTDTELTVYWVDNEGQNKPYSNVKIAPRGTAAFQTHKGNQWRFFSTDNQYFGEYVATDDVGQNHEIAAPEAAELSFKNKSYFNVQIYEFDPWVQGFVLRGGLKPQSEATFKSSKDAFWVTAVENVRLANHDVKAGKQSINVDVPHRKFTVKNARTTETSVYSITNTNEKHRRLGVLRPGEEGKYTAWVGAIVTFRENEELIGTARVTIEEKQEFELLDEEVAANSGAADVPVAVDFINQTGQVLIASLLLPSLEDESEDGENDDVVPLDVLRENTTKRIEAFPFTSWLVSTQDGAIVGEYDISLLPIQQIVLTPSDIPAGK